MTNTAATTHLATHLATGLVHPGDNTRNPTPLLLPGLSATAIPPDMAAEFANQAGLPHADTTRLVAEAIIACIENLDGGSTIIADTELAALRQQAADAPDGTRIISLHCHCDRTHTNPLLTLRVGKTDHTTIDATPLLAALRTRSPDCPHHQIADQ